MPGTLGRCQDAKSTTNAFWGGGVAYGSAIRRSVSFRILFGRPPAAMFEDSVKTDFG